MEISQGIIHDAVFGGGGIPQRLFDSVQNGVASGRDSLRQLRRIRFQEGSFVEEPLAGVGPGEWHTRL